MVTKDRLLANGPVMAEYGNVECVAILHIPVKYCGLFKTPSHSPHRYEYKGFDGGKWRPEDTWYYCPGRS